MGRKRRRINEQLPQYVYRKRGGFIYRPYLGRGKFGKDVYLCSQKATMGELWAAYDEKVNGVERNTISWLLGMYHAGEAFAKRKPVTQSSYEGYRNRIISRVLPDGSVFGSADLTSVDMYTIKGYLRTYTAPNGTPAHVAANRHIQYLKAAWNWARSEHQGIPENPCVGVALNEEKSRVRYVTDDEYTIAITAAMESGTPYLAAFMELAVLCRARRGEIAALRESDIDAEGITLNRSKGSEGEVTTWTRRLTGAVQYARGLHTSAPVPITGALLIHDRHGHPIKKNAFDSAWRRLTKKLEALGIERFTFHDLKAKGVSDHKDNAGVSDAMRHVYVRKLKRVEATE